MWNKYKYLIAYLLPISCFCGLFLGGYAGLGAFYVAFILLPILEQIIPLSKKNLDENMQERYRLSRFFDLLLYLNIPLLYTILGIYFWNINNQHWSIAEVCMQTLNVGIVVGVIGINVAHELGHRPESKHHWMAHALLLPALYQHFFVEHNRGHHRHVGTDQDPSSARKGEAIYTFWVRSVMGTYKSAWQLELERIHRRKISPWSFQNLMFRFTFFQLIYLVGLWIYGGIAILSAGIAVAVIGFLLLESVNYIEHYGLRRKKLSNGRYEKVMPYHSWNSEHELGRIVLYELTRHSDHHYMESIKYQNLRYQEKSPQLPYGYPASILLALLPPLWFKEMDARLAEFTP